MDDDETSHNTLKTQGLHLQFELSNWF